MVWILTRANPQALFRHHRLPFDLDAPTGHELARDDATRRNLFVHVKRIELRGYKRFTLQPKRHGQVVAPRASQALARLAGRIRLGLAAQSHCHEG